MMLTSFSRTTRLFGGIIVAVLIITIIIIAINGNKIPAQQVAQYINDNASADNKVEVLKTMTANLLAVEHKNKQLQKNIETLQNKNQQAIAELKQSLSKQVQQALQTMQANNHIGEKTDHQHSSSQVYPINGDLNDNDTFTWVSDLSLLTNSALVKQRIHQLEMDDHSHRDSLLHDQLRHNEKKIRIKPVYTIPVNATLTGATLMTPLVGRVPIDGKLPSPYHFKLVLSAKNLTANGYPMPGIKGAVMSGVASGDMLGSCARGDVHTITFIFNDGTISTTQVQTNDDSLGYISSQTGNPCIAGTFHTNAALFLEAQIGLAGAEGYVNAITNSQYMNTTTPEGTGIHTLIGSANKAAMGQDGVAAADAARKWWNRRVENSFDYVYVPNINQKTKRSMKVVVNIAKAIAINYNPTARKVSYENALQHHYRELD